MRRTSTLSTWGTALLLTVGLSACGGPASEEAPPATQEAPPAAADGGREAYEARAAELAQELWAALCDPLDPYWDWGAMPPETDTGGKTVEVGGFLQADKMPHGDWVRIVANETARRGMANVPYTLDYGSIVVKENYPPSPPSSDPPTRDQVRTITVMWKVEGYKGPATVPAGITDPQFENIEWYWVMYDKNGNVQFQDGWPEWFKQRAGTGLSQFANDGPFQGKPRLCTECHQWGFTELKGSDARLGDGVMTVYNHLTEAAPAPASGAGG